MWANALLYLHMWQPGRPWGEIGMRAPVSAQDSSDQPIMNMSDCSKERPTHHPAY